jgi:guanylate kinase
LDNWFAAGSDVLLDIDVQGARQVRCAHPSAHNIFILPPSLNVLELRLKARGTEPPEKVAARMTAARRELQDAPWYDFIVVNDVLEEAVVNLVAIIRALRCRRDAQLDMLKAIIDFQTPPS